jgi:hypothetical protein
MNQVNQDEIKGIIQKELPEIIAQDPLIRDFILRTVSNYYAGKPETESKFERILSQMERDREEQSRKWEEQNQKWSEQNEQNKQVWVQMERDREEQSRKWEEQNQKWSEQNEQNKQIWVQMERDREEQSRKWEEQNQKWSEQNEQNKQIWVQMERDREEQSRKWEEQNQKWSEQNEQNKQVLAEIKLLNRKHDSSIGALGSRWGLNSEASFRNALKGILQDSFGVEVLNINEFDAEGEVFGHPDQVEIDVIIKNGLVIVCEIKSSISKSEMYNFERKVGFYQKHHQCTVNRKIVISPMVNANALPVAQNLGIEVYSYAEDVQSL